VQAVDKGGHSADHALWEAAQQNRAQGVEEFLCARGSARNLYLFQLALPALYVAACNDHVDTVAVMFRRFSTYVFECFSSTHAHRYAQSLLHVVARHGSTACAQLLLHAKATVPASAPSPLWIAARHGHVDILRMFLAADAFRAVLADHDDDHDHDHDDDDDADRFNGSRTHLLCRVLSAAAKVGCTEAVHLVLQAKADVGSEYCTALPDAAKHGQIEALRLLLRAKASMNATCSTPDRSAALQCAVFTQNLPMVELLVQNKADVNWTDSPHRCTPVRYAVKKERPDILRRLLRAKAHVDGVEGRREPPATEAAVAQSPEMLRLLLRAKADADVPVDACGRTPLHLAADKGLETHVRLLLQARATVDKAASNGWFVPVYRAAAGGHDGTVALLVQAKADVDAAFHFAMRRYTVCARDAKNLLKAKVQINLPRPGDGVTPLWAAAHSGCTHIVQELLEAKAEVGAQCLGLTPVGVAAMHWRTQSLQLLLKAKGDPNGLAVATASRTAWTPLAAATQGNYHDAMQMLLDAKADCNARVNAAGWTALHFARTAAAVWILRHHNAHVGARTELPFTYRGVVIVAGSTPEDTARACMCGGVGFSADELEFAKMRTVYARRAPVSLR